ncbi:MAG: Poly-beta-1,6-N-acetyl-D-glucosamine synthase [Candidatus Omnitrophica bacterium ADurb.Bin277]|nr:MAG: Poly-beta-1,6-N-acetyl-D-glucosamine synthase [Candidatus Omnitrophica bacterium ADurb.Bin277]
MMLSIVILTHNSIESIRFCLDSVFDQGVSEKEVIVVDNASSDGTKEFVKKNYADVRLIENPGNYGASKARNQGIEASSGDWVLSLDSDVVLEKNFLKNFTRTATALESTAGMIQPNVLNAAGREVYSHGIRLTVFRRFYDLNRGKPRSCSGEVEKKIIGPCSAAAFYSRRMLDSLKESTGYFDERFFFLVEDVDLAWRAWRAGWRTKFCPESVCFHSGNGSNTDIAARRYLCFRNRRLMIQKNENFIKRLCLHLLTAPYELARFLRLLISGEYRIIQFLKW